MLFCDCIMRVPSWLLDFFVTKNAAIVECCLHLLIWPMHCARMMNNSILIVVDLAYSQRKEGGWLFFELRCHDFICSFVYSVGGRCPFTTYMLPSSTKCGLAQGKMTCSVEMCPWTSCDITTLALSSLIKTKEPYGCQGMAYRKGDRTRGVHPTAYKIIPRIYLYTWQMPGRLKATQNK